MIKFNKFWIILNFVGLISISSFIIFKELKSKKEIVFIDNEKLFEGFKMTVEVKRSAEQEFNKHKNTAEVLYSKLQSKQIPDQTKKELQIQFTQEKMALDKMGGDFAAQQSAIIWSRIQNYMKSFAKEKNYKLVVGSETKGQVLFADETVDVTWEALSFINQKYEGVQ